jgi:DNA-binding CsgD family transcriptional regulator
MRTAGLSDRERQFSTMLLAGNTHREIATANNVAESTVKATLSNSYRKLGVSSANELRRLEADFKIVD